MVLIIIGANCDLLPTAHGLQQNLNPSVMGKFCNVINDVIQLFLRKRKVQLEEGDGERRVDFYF